MDTRLYDAQDQTVREYLDLYHDAFTQASGVLGRVAAQDNGWPLETCKNLVASLDGALRKNRRFLLFACSRSAQDLDPAKKLDMLATQAMMCSVGMLGCSVTAGKADSFARLAGLAGMVHNLGMALIPDEIVTKPGKLSGAQFKKLREHTEICAKLPQIAQEPELAQIVSQSRERLDGSGYPQGLSGRQLHPVSLFLHAVDTFVALTQPRPHRQGQNGYEALKVLKLDQMPSLSKEVVGHLLRFYTVYPVGSCVKLNTEEQGKVVDTNPGQILRPFVAVLLDAAGRPYDTPVPLDLSVQPHVFITGSVENPELRRLGAEVC